MADPAPFIVTATLDEAAQARFNGLRQAHFPADRLFVGAHVTLFHALPRDLDVVEAVRIEAASVAPLPVQVAAIRFLGAGVAFTLLSAPLTGVRNRLRQRWAARLTAQDAAAWRPHVTVQNKVTPAIARSLYQALSAEFAPSTVMATGLAVWIYRSGPWQAVGDYAFTGSAGAS